MLQNKLQGKYLRKTLRETNVSTKRVQTIMKIHFIFMFTLCSQCNEKHENFIERQMFLMCTKMKIRTQLRFLMPERIKL